MSEPRTLADFPFHLDTPFQLQALRHVGTTLATAAERKELLEKLRAGEHVEIDVDAVTYIQRDTPNRNFVRFKDSILRKLAKSGVGNPFLTDHRQRDVLARGGTITKSAAKKNDAGEWEFHQTFHLVKPWAVEGVLDGTIDRFSIGWAPTGPIIYRHSGEHLEVWPRHWPGDEIEVDGETVLVEWVFTAAELVETSGVNVPAVVGTGVGDFRAALAAHLGSRPTPNREGPSHDKEKSMHRLLKALGLSADAAEESALAAVEELERNRAAADERADAAELELKAEREAHDKTKAELATHEERAAAEASAKLSSAIDGLYEEGKLTRLHGKGAAQPDPYEETLREIHDHLGYERFAAAAARLSGKVPVRRQASSEDPEPRNGEVVVLSARHKKMIAQMGMSEEEYVSNLEKGGRLQ